MAAAPAGHADGPAPGVGVRELQRIQRQRQAASTALHEARHDTLTGLSRRALFTEQLQALLSANQTDLAGRVGLVYIDLDGFKAVNDRDGHAEGDRLLASFGRLLRRHLRATDPASRMGGDEFVAALRAEPEHLLATLQALAQHLLAETPRLAPGLGCSIGLALAEPGETPAALMARADHALLAAKRAGKGRVVLAD